MLEALRFLPALLGASSFVAAFASDRFEESVDRDELSELLPDESDDPSDDDDFEDAVEGEACLGRDKKLVRSQQSMCSLGALQAVSHFEGSLRK